MNWRIGITQIAIVLLFTLGYCAAHAAELDLEKALRDAAYYSGMDLPDRMPHTIVVSSDEIDVYVPPIAGRSAWGFYRHDKKTLYLSAELEKLDPVESHGWLIHEMTHVLQDTAGRKFDTCFDRKLLEAQAYHVQNKWLRSRNRRPQPFSAALYPCH